MFMYISLHLSLSHLFSPNTFSTQRSAFTSSVYNKNSHLCVISATTSTAAFTASTSATATAATTTVVVGSMVDIAVLVAIAVFLLRPWGLASEGR
jgi:hypothetical protein